MQKTLLFTLCLATATCPLAAQNAWQKTIPPVPQSVYFVRLSQEGDQYLIGTQNSFAEVDKLGSVTGYHRQSSGSLPFWTSTIKKYSATTGHPYFLMAKRGSPSASSYSLLEYRPGWGVVNEKVFADSMGAFTGKRPLLTEWNDSTFVVFGRKDCRKVKYSQSAGFTEEWVKPLNLLVESVIIHNNRFIVADAGGYVVALDENGDIVWSQYHYPLSFRSLQPVADGFIGCGRTFNEQAFIVKLDFAGMKIWEKEADDDAYYDIISTPAGYAMTGETMSGNIMLALTDADGNQVWKQEYGPGVGAQLLQDPDGGFVVAARGEQPFSFKLIKTDALGSTAPAEDAFINNRRIETTSVQATLDPWPSLFFDANDATFISIPDSAATIFSFAPWIGGLDENDSLHIATADYGSAGQLDYQTGVTQGKKRELNRVWKATRGEINRLRLDFGTDHTLDQPVPFDLLTWPSKGNPNLRYNPDFSPVETDPYLFPAPFTDANGDGIYNVYDGDYPYLEGDQMAWWMLTDSVTHDGSKGEILGVDLLISVYAYDCPQTGSVDKSLFADFDIINRSATNFHDVYMGFFTDFNLGCYHNDYIGTLPNENTFYVYNQDSLDVNCYQGVQGFGENIPVQTVTFLNQSLDHSLFYYNPGVGNQLPGTIDPEIPQQYYNYLQSKWKDGTPLTSGGIGYNPGSTDYTNYIFPDNPADLQGWSMCVENLTNIADRRMINSHGPFDFAAGDTFHIQVAFTFHPDIPHPCPDVFGLVKPAVAQISQWKNDGALDVGIDLGQVVNLPPGQSVELDPGTAPGATYLWSTGASTPAITVSQPGEYSVTVTPATGCTVVENVLVQFGTSTNQPSQAPVWSVRPNPARSFVFIECPDCSDGDVQVIARNAQGVSLLNLQGQNKQIHLATNNLLPGFYWLELWQGGQFLGCRKLVLMDK